MIASVALIHTHARDVTDKAVSALYYLYATRFSPSIKQTGLRTLTPLGSDAVEMELPPDSLDDFTVTGLVDVYNSIYWLPRIGQGNSLLKLSSHCVPIALRPPSPRRHWPPRSLHRLLPSANACQRMEPVCYLLPVSAVIAVIAGVQFLPGCQRGVLEPPFAGVCSDKPLLDLFSRRERGALLGYAPGMN